jgi:hypothetical protein
MYLSTIFGLNLSNKYFLHKLLFRFQNLVCCAADVLEGRGLVQIAITVTELLRFHSPRSPLHTNPISTVI